MKKLFFLYLCFTLCNSLHNMSDSSPESVFLPTMIGQVGCLANQDSNPEIEKSMLRSWTTFLGSQNKCLPKDVENGTISIIYYSKVYIFLHSDLDEVLQKDNPHGMFLGTALTEPFITNLIARQKNSDPIKQKNNTQVLNKIKSFIEKSSHENAANTIFIQNSETIYKQVCDALGVPEEIYSKKDTNPPSNEKDAPTAKHTPIKQPTQNPAKQSSQPEEIYSKKDTNQPSNEKDAPTAKHTPIKQPTQNPAKQSSQPEEQQTEKKTTLLTRHTSVNYATYILALIATTALVAGTIYLVKCYFSSAKKKVANPGFHQRPHTAKQ